MNKELDPEQLEHRLSKWVGYGDLNGPFWFLGTEEGGKTSFKEQELRISLPQVSDIAEFMNKLHQIQYAPWMKGKHPPLQKTYSGLIKIYLCANKLCGFDRPTQTTKERSIFLEKVREFQRNKFGRQGSQTLVAELMPLSSKNMNNWEHQKYSNRPDLKTRGVYLDSWMPRRKTLFRSLIECYRPKVVLAYGKPYWEHYKSLTENKSYVSVSKNFSCSNTQFVLIQHPGNAVSNKNLETTGHWIRENILE